MAAVTDTTQFRKRLLAPEAMLGTFVRTSSHQTVEVLGHTGLDFVVIDGEHAPIDRSTMDAMVLAARSVDLPALVRLPSPAPENVLSILDMGATGMLVPHVASPSAADAVARAARYEDGLRGFSSSHRAADYGGMNFETAIAVGDNSATVIAQIEDIEALDHLDAIAATDGIHGLFVGRADLAVAFGATTMQDPRIDEVIEATCAAARQHNKAAGTILPDFSEREKFADMGASFFLLGTDQGMLRSAYSRVVKDFAGGSSS